MTNNIVNSPSSDGDWDWNLFKSIIVSALDKEGASQQLKDIVTSRMKDAYEEHLLCKELRLPLCLDCEENSNINKVFEFQAALQEHIYNLLVSRLGLEIRLAKTEV